MLTVLHRDSNRGYDIVPTKDCSYKGEHPKLFVVLRGVWRTAIASRMRPRWRPDRPSYGDQAFQP